MEKEKREKNGKGEQEFATITVGVIFDASPDAIALSDFEGRIVKINKTHAKMYGYDSPDEMIGMNWRQFVAKTDLERSWKVFEEGMMKNGEVRNHEATIVQQFRKFAR